MAAIERNDCEQLANEYARAKAAENVAKEARVKAEAALAEALGGKDDGSTSFKCGPMSVTVKRGWNYKVDDIDEFAKRFPALVKVKPELHATAYEKARRENAELFEEACQHVTATPKKVSVEIKI